MGQHASKLKSAILNLKTMIDYMTLSQRRIQRRIQICDRAFYENSSWLKPANYFRKDVPS